jgi:4-diphosphocytidyl-2-C-methyl-D-erythritol kinase
MRESDGAIRVAAPAKVNLYLHVLGRRADGFHELDSLVGFADIADFVIARPAPRRGLTLTIDGPFAEALCGDTAENLVLRAARLLAARAGVAADAALSLTKILPVASGIGGGSSDAAASLRALARLWRVRLGESELAALAAELGADVPVCLQCRTAWLGGIGERLEPAPKLPPVAILLANPGIALPPPPSSRRAAGHSRPPPASPARRETRRSSQRFSPSAATTSQTPQLLWCRKSPSSSRCSERPRACALSA